MSDRHQFRATWHDYNDGLYFVTICCADKKYYFGDITDSTMQLSEIGKIADIQIREIPTHFKNAEILNSVIMPNHIHIVIAINGPHVGTLLKASAANVLPICELPAKDESLGCLKPRRHDAPESQDFHHNTQLSIIIRCLKGGITREAHLLGYHFEWQPRFHEHIIRHQRAYDNIMNYIDSNVDKWGNDCFNSNRISDTET